MNKKTIFKSGQGKQDIFDHYKSLFAVLEVSYEEAFVETSFGKTYLLEAGSKSAPPLLLFHGSCSNSAMWFADINRLSAHFRVFAVDIIGEAGFSAEKRLDLKTDEYAMWINDILAALGYEQVMLMGNSLGGWMALKFATVYPQKAAKIVLIAAAGIVPVRISFICRTFAAVIRGEKGLKALGEKIFGEDDIPQEVIEFSDKIMRGFNPITGSIPIIPDEQMKQLIMPLLFICGENDITMNARKAALRIKRIIPHSMTYTKTRGHVVYDTMKEAIPFLKGGE